MKKLNKNYIWILILTIVLLSFYLPIFAKPRAVLQGKIGLIDPLGQDILTNPEGSLLVTEYFPLRLSVGRPFAQVIDTTSTLSIIALPGAISIDIQAADYADFSIGDFIDLRNTILGEKYYLKITDKSAPTTLILSSPLDFPYLPGSIVTKVETAFCTADGSLANPISFKLQPPANQIWEITSCSMLMESVQSIDTSKFGSIPELTNGLILRIFVNGSFRTVAIWRSNGDLIQFSGKLGGFYEKGAAGNNGIQININLKADKILIPVTLDGRTTDSKGKPRLPDFAEILVQDDLTINPAITKCSIFCQGNIKELILP